MSTKYNIFLSVLNDDFFNKTHYSTQVPIFLLGKKLSCNSHTVALNTAFIFIFVTIILCISILIFDRIKSQNVAWSQQVINGIFFFMHCLLILRNVSKTKGNKVFFVKNFKFDFISYDCSPYLLNPITSYRNHLDLFTVNEIILRTCFFPIET